MRIIGYGEDSMTLWALKNRLGEILTQLGDQTPPHQCRVFYRPSFGRRGGNKRSGFGEFDAIIATPSATYLIESKRDAPGVVINGVINLLKHQIRRHKVFKYYFYRWLVENPDNWGEFADAIQDDFGQPVPGADTILAANLSYILRETTEISQTTVNVLLFLHRENHNHLPVEVNGNDEEFELVNLECEFVNDQDFLII